MRIPCGVLVSNTINQFEARFAKCGKCKRTTIRFMFGHLCDECDMKHFERITLPLKGVVIRRDRAK